jgi:acylphosphatase
MKFVSNVARKYFVRGRVQGVGYRYFAERAANDLGLSGYTRNLDDGRVEVYAIGPLDRLNDLAGLLWQGPRWADVRGVEEREEPVVKYRGFHIER